MTGLTPQQFLSTYSQLRPKERLEALVGVLRGPQGCPWDQRQGAESIIDFLIDEAHELKQALARGQSEEIAEELGDLAFTFTFLAQTLEASAPLPAAVDRVVAKMIARHPHVFEPEAEATSEAQVKRRWESLKGEGKGGRRLDRDLAASLPAWQKAAKVLTRARNAGFRYPDAEAAWEKVSEEWLELQEALERGEPERCRSELGDLLLALLTASTESGLDGELALTASARKLADRLEQVEELASRPLSEIPYEELASWYARARSQAATPAQAAGGAGPHAEAKSESGSPRPPGAYFNYCGVSPWPPSVSRAVFRAARLVGRTGLAGALQLRLEREALRPKIARFVDGPADGVVYLPNVSSAALGAAYSLDWRRGDSLLVGRHEFPANTVPWRLAAETLGLHVHTFDDDLLRRDPEGGWAALQAQLLSLRPRLLAVSAVSYWSGYRLPVARLSGLCRKTGTLLFVDAVQALGTVPLSMSEGIDLLACGSHKTLLAPEAAGFLVVSGPVRERWVPRLGSWLSLPDPVDFLLAGRDDLDPNAKQPRAQDPTVLEGGSQNCLGYAGLDAALEHLSALGVETILAHVQRLHDGLEQGLCGLGFASLRAAEPQCRSAILSFEPPPGVDLVGLQAGLAQEGIQAGIPRGRLRFGCHAANSAADVERVLSVMPGLL
jgi:MazG family protein